MNIHYIQWKDNMNSIYNVSLYLNKIKSAIQSKKAVCANIKHNIDTAINKLMTNFRSIHSHAKRLYGHYV